MQFIKIFCVKNPSEFSVEISYIAPLIVKHHHIKWTDFNNLLNMMLKVIQITSNFQNQKFWKLKDFFFSFTLQPYTWILYYQVHN